MSKRSKKMYKIIKFDTEGCNGRVIGKEETLYNACDKIRNKRGGIVLQKKRMVAFWDGWNKKVRPGPQATEEQKQAVIDYRL